MTNARPNYIKAYEPWSVILFVDPVAIALTPVIAALRIHPNIITAGVLLSGLAAGVLFGSGYWLWAAASFLFSHFLDCIDGKVARLRQLTSKFGAKFDSWADYVRRPACFFGVAFYFYRNNQTVLLLLTGVLFALHVFVHTLYRKGKVCHYDIEFPEFHRRIIRRFVPRALALYTYFEEFVLLFVVFPIIAALIGMPEGAVWFLWGALIATTLTFLKFCIVYNHRRKGRYDQVQQKWPVYKINSGRM